MERLLANDFARELKLHFNLKQVKESDKLTQIMLVTTVNGQRIRVYTKLRVRPQYWDKTLCQCRTEQAPNLRTMKLLEKINQQIVRLKETIRRMDKQLAQKGKSSSAASIREIVKSLQCTLSIPRTPLEILHMLVAEYPNIVNRRGKRGTVSTRRTYEMAVKRLENYCFEEGLALHSFDDFDQQFFNRFANYLYSYTFREGNRSLNYTQNTVINTLKVIKNLLHRAYDRGLTDNNQFMKAQTTLPSNVSGQVYLEEQEIKQLSSLELTGRKKMVRDMFVISCYTALRVSDILQLRNAVIRDNTISLYQTKTKEQVNIPILKEILPLVTHYQQCGFPTFDPCQANLIIKQLVRQCGIDEEIHYKEHRGGDVQIASKPKWAMVTFHTARRSCITNLYRRGYPVNYIMSLSGHKSMQAFQRYMRASSNEVMSDFVSLLKEKEAI